MAPNYRAPHLELAAENTGVIYLLWETGLIAICKSKNKGFKLSFMFALHTYDTIMKIIKVSVVRGGRAKEWLLCSAGDPFLGVLSQSVSALPLSPFSHY